MFFAPNFLHDQRTKSTASNQNKFTCNRQHVMTNTDMFEMTCQSQHKSCGAEIWRE